MNKIVTVMMMMVMVAVWAVGIPKDVTFDEIKVVYSQDDFDDSITTIMGTRDPDTGNNVMFMKNPPLYSMTFVIGLDGVCMDADILIYRINKEPAVRCEAELVGYELVNLVNDVDCAVMLGRMIELDKAGKPVTLTCQVVGDSSTSARVSMQGISQAYSTFKK